MEIPDELLCLFSGEVERDGERYVVEVPKAEFEHGQLDPNETYRVAVFPVREPDDSVATERAEPTTREHPEPPVDEGDVRTVEIEGIGDQGDGIARVDRGYVVIVPGTRMGEEVEVEIEETRPNFAMASVVDEPSEE